MLNKYVYKNPQSEYTKNLVDIVKQFIQFTDKLLIDGAITHEQHEQLVRNKIQFLNNFGTPINESGENC